MEDSMNIDIERLIALVRERPIIWDKRLDQCKSRDETVDAWGEVCCVLNTQYETLSEEEKYKYGKYVSQRWANVRDKYTRYLKRRSQEKRAGSKAKSVKKCVYAEQLSFLCKSIKQRKTLPSAKLDHKNESTESSETETTSQPTQSSNGKKRKTEFMTNDLFLSVYENHFGKGDRHVCFFKGILPAVRTFCDTETIDFQWQVLRVIQNIQKARETRNTQVGPVFQGINEQQSLSYDRPEHPVCRRSSAMDHYSSNTIPHSTTHFNSQGSTSRSTSSTSRDGNIILSQSQDPNLSRPEPSHSTGSERMHSPDTTTPVVGMLLDTASIHPHLNQTPTPTSGQSPLTDASSDHEPEDFH